MFKVSEDIGTRGRFESPYASGRGAAAGDKDELWYRLNAKPAPAYRERNDYRGSYSPAPNYGGYDRYAERERESRYENPNRSYIEEDIPVGGGFDYRREEAMPRITRKEKKKRTKMPAKYKALAIVYSAIIVAIMTLVLVNTIPTANAAGEPSVSYELPSDAINKTADGATLGEIEKNRGYVYDTSTNGFDEMCDWMENFVG